MQSSSNTSSFASETSTVEIRTQENGEYKSNKVKNMLKIQQRQASLVADQVVTFVQPPPVEFFGVELCETTEFPATTNHLSSAREDFTRLKSTVVKSRATTSIASCTTKLLRETKTLKILLS